jgi:hypothetical protein
MEPDGAGDGVLLPENNAQNGWGGSLLWLWLAGFGETANIEAIPIIFPSSKFT